jgi:hypothetical protein
VEEVVEVERVEPEELRPRATEEQRQLLARAATGATATPTAPATPPASSRRDS